MDQEQATARVQKTFEDVAETMNVLIKFGRDPGEVSRRVVAGLADQPAEFLLGMVEELLAGLPEEDRRVLLAKLSSISPDQFPPA